MGERDSSCSERGHWQPEKPTPDHLQGRTICFTKNVTEPRVYGEVRSYRTEKVNDPEDPDNLAGRYMHAIDESNASSED
jgi:hypothetical protein